MQNQDILRIVMIACLVLAAWPYACLVYLSELKKISKELIRIRQILKEKQCEDTSAESTGSMPNQ